MKQYNPADFLNILDEVIDKAIRDNEFKQADEFTKLGGTIAKNLSDDENYQLFKKKRQEIRKQENLAKEDEQAVAMLQVNPEDAAANLTHATYLFTVAMDSEESFAYFAKTSNLKLKALAQLERDAVPGDSKSLMLRALAWESVGRSETGLMKTKSFERAILLFKSAWSNADMADRQVVEEKVKSLTDEIKK